MELSLVLVLTLVTLGAATPHGYGVKGGASAKAEASAVAGGFGDLGPVPLSIPSGAAYSGSFSKASSSSFASSSASSSSSSYSFSGSGANGIGGINADGLGHKGCSSGTCQGAFGHLNGAQQFGGANAVAAAQAKAISGVNGIEGNSADGRNNKGCSSGNCPGVGAAGSSLNGDQQSGGANAAAAQAKALAGSYTPCQGPDCHGSLPEKCSSGQCPSKTEIETPSSENGLTTDCSSGQCEKDKQGSVDSDSNDFAVNINRKTQSKQSYDSNGQYSGKDKPYSSESHCANGKCGPTNSYPNNGGNNQYQPSVPATYLTTPSHNPPCTTASCKYPGQGNGPQTGSLPSSYNVPIQSATNSPNTYSPSGSVQHGLPCTSPGCNTPSYNVGTSNVPKYNYGQKELTNQGPCVSGQCGIPSSSNVLPTSTGSESDLQSPNYSPIPGPSNIPSGHLGQPGCTTPNCAERPSNQPNLDTSTQPQYTIPTYSNLPSSGLDSSCGGAGCIGSPHSGSPAKPNKPDAPAYTGGFGGPPGVLDAASGYNKLPGSSGSPYGPTHTPVVSPSGAYGPTHGFSGTTKPNELKPPSQYTPTYTPSITGPTGVYGSTPTNGYSGTTKPNDANNANPYNPAHPSTNINSGAYGSTQIQGSFVPTYTPGNGGSSVPSTPSTQFTSSFGAPTSPSGTSPGSNIHPNYNKIDKPNSFVNTGSSPAYTGESEGSTGLSNANSGSNSIHGSFGITKPSTASNAPSNPTYSGGFGGPTGAIDGSSLTIGSTGSHTPSTSNCGLADCSGQPNANVNAGATSHDNTKPIPATSSQKKPVYTGGFGGPTGFLKPNDYSVPTPTSSLGNTPCTNGNCGPKGTPSSSYSPSSLGNTPCVNGKCGPEGTPSSTYGHGSALTAAQSLAAASASANAVAYSGGFGGPPGVLKPFDDGKGHSSNHGTLGSGQSPTFNAAHPNIPSASGKDSGAGNSGSGANIGAHASAIATASAGIYNGNNEHQHNNGLSGGCNSGCGSNHGSNGANSGFPEGFLKNTGASSIASAKSVAGANSFGYGGNFASSSASAHSSASAGTKGGYGRK